MCSPERDAGIFELFTDLIEHFDRVADLYPYPPSSIDSLLRTSRFEFPDSRRAALVEAIAPLNQGNPVAR